MEKMKNSIKKEFGNEFDFLQLFEVVYDEKSNICKIVFLFPQHIDEITKIQREKLEAFLTSFLKLNANIELKFRKSFLDNELIENFVLNYFKTNNFSLFTTAERKNISVKKDLAEIIITLTFEKAIYDYIEENQILLGLKKELEKNFIAKFLFELQEGKEQIDKTILEKREAQVKVETEQKIARYTVFDPVRFFGKEIEPYPEFVKNQTQERENVILAGEISNIVKKSYKSKFKKTDEESYFYTFELYDTTGQMSAIHFANKSTLSKLEAFSEGMQLLFLGDVKKNTFGKLTYYVKSAYHCEINKDVIKKAQKDFEKEQFLQSDQYQLIFPQQFVDAHQENLFFKREYNNLIKNNTIVVFDVETTGLEPEFAEIIEIGAVKVVNGELIETFQTLIKPEKEIPSLITEITSITNEMVKDAPSIKAVLTDFILFARDSILSGYNVGFDMRFLQKAAGELGFHFSNRVEDTMAYARAQLSLNNYTLKNVAKNLNISLTEAHRALNDAIATARALIELNRIN